MATQAVSRQRSSTYRRVLAVLFWLIAWQAVAWTVNRPLLLAGPLETLGALSQLVVTPGYWASAGLSALHIALGFFAGLLLGLGLAVPAAAHPALGAFLEPPLLALKAVPVACLVVILLLWVGSAGVGVACTFIVVLPAYYFSALGALQSRNKTLEDALSVQGLRGSRKALALLWPQMIGYLSATSKVCVGMAWKAGVAAELIALSGITLGAQVYQAKLLLETSQLMAWTITIVACAYLSERLFLALLDASAQASFAWVLASDARAGTGQQTPGASGSQAAEKPVPPTPAPLAASHLQVTYGGTPLAEDLSFEVAPGQVLCVRGVSGAGKTTLIKTLLGLVRPGGGSLEVPAQMGYMGQEPTLIESRSAIDNVRLVARCSAQAAQEALAEVGLGAVASRSVAQLSGGQRRRVELVRALMAPGAAVILDEPFYGLDEQARQLAYGFILAHQNQRPLVVAVHEEADVQALGASLLEVGV